MARRAAAAVVVLTLLLSSCATEPAPQGCPGSWPGPLIEGQVVLADAEARTVRIDKGRDAGVTIGRRIDVVRRAEYVGAVCVTAVAQTWCDARVDVLKPGHAVAVGDRATTILN